MEKLSSIQRAFRLQICAAGGEHIDISSEG